MAAPEQDATRRARPLQQPDASPAARATQTPVCAPGANSPVPSVAQAPVSSPTPSKPQAQQQAARADMSNGRTNGRRSSRSNGSSASVPKKRQPAAAQCKGASPAKADRPSAARPQTSTPAPAAGTKSAPPSRHGTPARPPTSPRAEWRDWSEVTVKVDGLPFDVTTKHLWHCFTIDGSISRIEILDAPPGNMAPVSAKVSFEPPPRHPFWHKNVIHIPHTDRRKHPNGIKVTVALVKEAPGRRILTASHPQSKIVLGLRQLDFGSMTGPTAMTIMKSIKPASPSARMELELDVRDRRFSVYFPVAAKTQYWSGTRQFCFRVDVSNMSKLYETVSADGTLAWVLPLARPPCYYWRVDDVETTFSPDLQTWSERNVWFRATDVVSDLDSPMRYPVAVHTDVDDPAYVDVGNWTTVRIVLANQARREERETRRLMFKELEELNVSVEHSSSFAFHPAGKTMWDFLDHPPPVANGQASALLQMTASPVVHLPFEVRFQLEVCVSRGVLNENTVTVDFLQRLAALKPFDATRRLEYLADQNEQVFDPMQLFDNSDAESYIPNTRLPHYCTLMRKAAVTPTAVRYSTPTVETSNRVVRKYNHMQDRFLRVQFIEEAEQGRIAFNKQQNDEIWKRMLRTLYQGIRIGDRVYEFLGFGNSQLRECGAYFFCPTEHTSCDDIRRWMGDFDHIRVVAKYAARLGQCFSTTREIRGICKPRTRPIPDVERNGYCFTDGVGIISQFLARFIIEEMTLDVLDEPTAFQFRMGGSKGVLAVGPQAKGMDVLVRKSQEKFKAEFNGLEIIKCAKLSTATLNRQTIPILECLGVPLRAFLNLLDRQIQEYTKAMVDNSVAIRLLTKYIDEGQNTLILAELLQAGFNNEDILEPFTVNLLNLWRSWSLRLLKEKARIHVDKSAFVLGCVDETGTLRGHSTATEGTPEKDVDKLPQIFLQLTDPTRCDQTVIIQGICIVGRNPSLHPGDIRVVQAVDNPRLHHLKDVVVFPSTGDRPVPNMLAGGDLDGDDFFCMWEPSLMPTEWNFPPMNYTALKPKELAEPVKVDDIRDFFVKYIKNDILGIIASSHVVYADQLGPKSQLCLVLAEEHSKAVDYPKTGQPADLSQKMRPKRWPHFMEKRSSYRSKKALGVIFDRVVKQTVQFRPDWEHAFDQRILSKFELDDDTLEKAKKIKAQYDICVRRVLAQHNVGTEFELYTAWAMSGPPIGTEYKRQEHLNGEFEAVKTRFREQCYEAAGGNDADRLDRFVAAMYRVTEQEMKAALDERHGRGLADEAGKVAAAKHTEPKSMPLISFPWIFHWVLIRIATGGEHKPRRSQLAAAQRREAPSAVALKAQDPPVPAADGEDEASVWADRGAAGSTDVLEGAETNMDALMDFDDDDDDDLIQLLDGDEGEAVRRDEEANLFEAETNSEAETVVAEEEPGGESLVDRLAAFMELEDDGSTEEGLDMNGTLNGSGSWLHSRGSLGT